MPSCHKANMEYDVEKQQSKSSTPDFTRSFLNEIQIYVHTLKSHEWMNGGEGSRWLERKNRTVNATREATRLCVVLRDDTWLNSHTFYSLVLRHIPSPRRTSRKSIAGCSTKELVDCLTHDLHFLISFFIWRASAAKKQHGETTK